MFYYKEGDNVCGGILPDNSAGTLERRGKKTLISRNPNKMDRFRKEMTNSYCIFISSSSGDLCVSVKSIKKKKSLGPAYFVIMQTSVSHWLDHILIFNSPPPASLPSLVCFHPITSPPPPPPPCFLPASTKSHLGSARTRVFISGK